MEKKKSSYMYKAGIVLAWCIIVFIILSALVRVVTPMLITKAELMETVSPYLGDYHLSIENVNARWHGWGPALNFQKISLKNESQTQTIFSAEQVDVKFSVWSWLQTGELLPIGITLDEGKASFIQDENRDWRLEGWNTHNASSSLNSSNEWLESIKTIVIKNSDINIQRYDEPLLDLVVSGKINFHKPDYKVKLTLALVQYPEQHVTFKGNLKGDLLDYKKLSGRWYTKVENIRPTKLVNNLSYDDVTLLSGVISAEVWAKQNEGHFQEIKTILKASHLDFESPSMQQKIQDFNIDGIFEWTNKDETRWELSGSKARFQLGNKNVPFSDFSVIKMVAEKSNLPKFSVNADYVELNSLDELALLIPVLPERFRELVVRLAPMGTLSNLEMLWEGDLTHPENDFKFVSLFQDVSVKPWGNIPELQNLTGNLNIHRYKGEINLKSQHFVFGDAALFLHPVTVGALDGKLVWHLIDDDIKVNLDHLNFRTGASNILLKGELFIPDEKEKSTDIDLEGTFTHLSAKQVLNYLPLNYFDKSLREWLEHAIKTGQVDNGTLVLKGPLDKFPFDNNEGEFIIRSDIHNAILAFDSNWPALRNLSGQLLFDKRNMTFTLSSGSLKQVPVTKTTAVLSNIGKASPLMLHVSSEASAQAPDAIAFLKYTPLWEDLGEGLSLLKPEGVVNVTMNLDLPLESGSISSNVNGQITFANATLDIPRWDLNFNDVNGVIDYSENGVTAKGIKATTFTGPITVGIKTDIPKKDKKLFTVTAVGHTALANIEKRYPNDFWTWARGDADFTAKLQFSNKTNSMPTLDIVSNLVGVDINVPAPFKKPKDQAQQMQLVLSWPETDYSVYQLIYGHDISGVIQLVDQKGETRFDRGIIKLGGGDLLPVPDLAGLTIEGRLETLNLSDLIHEFSSFEKNMPETDDTAFSMEQINSINLTVGRADIFGFILQHGSIKAVPKDNRWAVALNSNTTSGSALFSLPLQQNVAYINLNRCLMQTKDTGNKDSNEKPSDLFSFDFNCNNFYLDTTSIGDVTLKTRLQKNQLKIPELKITTKEYTLEASGDWRAQPRQTTSLKGKFVTSDIGKAIRSWNYDSEISKGAGTITFDLFWLASPTSLSLESLNGSVNMNIKNGTIIEVNPGVGRVFSLFSLNSIERRLRLDFSDVFKGGLAFDSFKGDFKIQNGNLTTENTLLKASAADIELKGSTHLVKKDLNFTVQVATHVVSTALPIAATIVTGNPAIGAIVWGVSKVVTPPIEKASGFRYRVTGSWETPLVTKY